MEKNSKYSRIIDPKKVKEIETEINKAIHHITRGSGLYKDEVEQILVNMYKDKLT